jgi:hypothetical protein
VHGRGAHVLRLQCLDQAQVFLLRDATHDGQAFRAGDAQAVHDLPSRCRPLHFLVELRAGAVQDDRRQADLLQEGQRGHQRVEFVAQDRAADLDHGEARRVELREALEVLLDFLRTRHV